MNYKLVKLETEYFVLNVDFSRMAKDLPEGTPVFCLDETHTGKIKKCVINSTKNFHCYGCQPLVASTLQLKDVNFLIKEDVENLLEGFSINEAEADEYTEKKLKPVKGMLSEDYAIGFKEGIEKYLDDNKDELFSLEEMQKAYDTGYFDSAFDRKDMNFETFIKNLDRENKEWDIQIYEEEGESKNTKIFSIK